MQYLCIIPARSGSKGIPLKNIIDLLRVNVIKKSNNKYEDSNMYVV